VGNKGGSGEKTGLQSVSYSCGKKRGGKCLFDERRGKKGESFWLVAELFLGKNSSSFPRRISINSQKKRRNLQGGKPPYKKKRGSKEGGGSL